VLTWKEVNMNAKTLKWAIETGEIDMGDAVVKMYPERRNTAIFFDGEGFCDTDADDAADGCLLLVPKGEICEPCRLATAATA
jgi:hypothetical protein